MPKYTGAARLAYGGKTRDVLLSLDLDESCLVVKHPQEKDLFAYLPERQRLWSLSDICLTDIIIPTVDGTLTAANLDGLFILAYSPGAMSVHDSPLNRALQLSNDQAGIVTLKLLPKNSVVEFDYSPRSDSDNEVFYSASVASFAPFSCEAAGETYLVVEKRPNLSIRSKALIWGNEPRIRLALSLLQGAPVSLMVSYESGKARVNLVRPRIYRSSHLLYDEYTDAPAIFEHLLRFATGLSSQAFRHWEKAAAFLLEGKASFAEADVRVVNLFVFLEMFDGSRTLSGNTLSRMLSIAHSDARFLCEVRNRLVHQKHDLNGAISDADAWLRCNDPSYGLVGFDLSGCVHPPVTNVLLRLCERLNCYVATQIGWKGKWNTYKTISKL
jgi:hypothetical protein